MAQAKTRLTSEDPSVERIAGKLVEKLRAKQVDGLLIYQPASPSAIGPKSMEPGVYFGLSVAAYHADPSLALTDVKRLLLASPVFWFHSWMNPKRSPMPESAAKLKGQALHKLIGEGVFGRVFAERFKG